MAATLDSFRYRSHGRITHQRPGPPSTRYTVLPHKDVVCGCNEKRVGDIAVFSSATCSFPTSLNVNGPRKALALAFVYLSDRVLVSSACQNSKMGFGASAPILAYSLIYEKPG